MTTKISKVKLRIRYKLEGVWHSCREGYKIGEGAIFRDFLLFIAHSILNKSKSPDDRILKERNIECQQSSQDCQVFEKYNQKQLYVNLPYFDNF